MHHRFVRRRSWGCLLSQNRRAKQHHDEKLWESTVNWKLWDDRKHGLLRYDAATLSIRFHTRTVANVANGAGNGKAVATVC